MLIPNPHAIRAPYPAELRSIMNIERAQESRRWLAAWPQIARAATPLHDLPGLARQLGVARVGVKDESVRSPLGSFKALGAPVALVRQVLRLHPDFEPTGVLTGRYATPLQGYTVISATDGNHGRALAAAARSAGCRCVIVLHAHVSQEREDAIAAHGAQIVRIAGNYDDSVAEAARLARANGWQVVSDTSYDGYEDIPRDVMQGYATIAAEVVEQTGVRPGEAGAFTHVFLQGGVGGMAAGLLSFWWEFHGAQRPHVIVVEPAQADCLLQSALQGRPARATGTVDSVMAGLACGETSPLAWRFLQPGVDHFQTVDDVQAVQAMRTLAQGVDGDLPLVAGESGVAGLAALQALRADPTQWAEAGLSADARVLLISTEGATAPQVYAQCVGESAARVLQRQAAWLARHP
ncbi:MAG: diaminopropionate ammonia-lyase [Burkholderiales bacterium]|nr:diaminopropionate ammonia-lyase [Burkholderiales bacterium]MBS0404432.1 diaminopropionate ammonia-lyase [Pseudomonadota bacterium]MBS0413219.1 diaminopropionate ammonia-lyase [Pseudomonadota bacterium]